LSKRSADHVAVRHGHQGGGHAAAQFAIPAVREGVEGLDRADVRGALGDLLHGLVAGADLRREVDQAGRDRGHADLGAAVTGARGDDLAALDAHETVLDDAPGDRVDIVGGDSH
jgi:hypothetical protein